MYLRRLRTVMDQLLQPAAHARRAAELREPARPALRPGQRRPAGARTSAAADAAAARSTTSRTATSPAAARTCTSTTRPTPPTPTTPASPRRSRRASPIDIGAIDSNPGVGRPGPGVHPAHQPQRRSPPTSRAGRSPTRSTTRCPAGHGHPRRRVGLRRGATSPTSAPAPPGPRGNQGLLVGRRVRRPAVGPRRDDRPERRRRATSSTSLTYAGSPTRRAAGGCASRR